MTVDEIKKLFASIGFVWDVYIPHNSEQGYVLSVFLCLFFILCIMKRRKKLNFLFRSSKGFAFVSFLHKLDAVKVCLIVFNLCRDVFLWPFNVSN